MQREGMWPDGRSQSLPPVSASSASQTAATPEPQSTWQAPEGGDPRGSLAELSRGPPADPSVGPSTGPFEEGMRGSSGDLESGGEGRRLPRAPPAMHESFLLQETWQGVASRGQGSSGDTAGRHERGPQGETFPEETGEIRQRQDSETTGLASLPSLPSLIVARAGAANNSSSSSSGGGSGAPIGSSTVSNSSSSSSSSSSSASSSSSLAAVAARASGAAGGGGDSRSSSSNSSNESIDSTSATHLRMFLSPSSSLDISTVLVPGEHAANIFRGAQKALARDMSVVIAFIKKKLHQQLLAAETPQLQLSRIDLVVEKVKNIKRRAEKAAEAAIHELERCSRRLKVLAHEPDLQQAQMKLDFSFVTFRSRVNWVLLEYLSRNGFAETAKKTAKCLALEDFWDGEVHAEVVQVITALQRESTAEAFAWIDKHSAKLRRLNSTLEAEVQIQQAIFLLKQKKAKEAVNFLREKCKPSDLERCPDICRVLALAAMLDCPPPQYEHLFGTARKRSLENLFLKTSAAVLGMTSEALLGPLVFGGLCALKSGSCQDSTSQSCPACLPELSSVVRGLPMPHRVRSNLICAVTGELMDEDNPPMASPEGHLVSKKGLALLTEKAEGGLVVCPKTNSRYPPTTFVRVYIT